MRFFLYKGPHLRLIDIYEIVETLYVIPFQVGYLAVEFFTIIPNVK